MDKKMAPIWLRPRPLRRLSCQCGGCGGSMAPIWLRPRPLRLRWTQRLSGHWEP